MSNASAANDLVRPLRRSTRLNAIVPITVMGVDSYRGPYRENVSTLTVSCHGCKYESKHDVLTNSWVMLELPPKDKGEAVSARGLVKWVKRPLDTSGVFETAIELENPGNIWGIDMPPQDWITFCESRLGTSGNGKSKPFALPKLEAPQKIAIPAKPVNGGTAMSSIAVSPKLPAPSDQRTTGLLMGEFHQQMEKMLFDAAAAAVREKASSTMDEVRHSLQGEAKRVLAEVASSQTASWIEQALKHLNRVSQESAKSFHAAWTKRLEADISRALERVEERGRELDTLAQSLSANALDRLQRGLESSRGEGVDRIVSKLREQSAPVIDHAKETIAELARQREQLQTVIEQSVAQSTSKVEQVCTDFQKQFEMIVREKLDEAREELQKTIQSTVATAVTEMNSSAQQQQAETQTRLRQAFESLETALGELKQQAAETSRQFASELSNHSRSHLESVSSAIAEAARGFGKPSGV
jgi:hypothetical protein